MVQAGLRERCAVGGVDTVHVGEDQALVGLHRRGDGHGRGVGAATAQGGDAALVHALEAGDDHHLAGSQIGALASSMLSMRALV
jgi:hypothetical protein